ncbi:MAG: DUF5004 domain-containing protein [Prolixibacteraceae bacterium]|nr:DUF5004 domain-containing protein [Prolixibacteraceae bacterium]
MKRSLIILFLVVLTQLFVGCYETDDGTFTEPITIYEKIGGTWELSKITEVDEIAVASSLKPDAINLTNYFDFKSFSITLNVDENFEPTTFEVGGNAPELFLKNGYWELSNPFPNTNATSVKIRLFADESKSEPVDELSIMALPGRRATLDFNLTRVADGIPFVTYEYALKLQD